MKYAAGLVSLLAALAFGQTWVVEQVDSTAASGSPVELVKAADGRLWAAYQADSVVRVARFGDTGWSMTDVCSGSLPDNAYRRPFMAAGPHGELCLSCRTSSPDTGRLYRLVGDTWQGEFYPFWDYVSGAGTVAYDTAGRLYSTFARWHGEFWIGHETDSGWVASFVVQLPAYAYFFWMDIGHLAAAADGSPWFFGFSGWDDGSSKGSYETELLHFSGDTWVSVWDVGGWPNVPPLPIALAPHGDGVGNLTFCNDRYVRYDSEQVVGLGTFLSVTGLTYSVNDVPLAAWVPKLSPTSPMFAFKTDRWRTEYIPGPAGIGGCDIEVDTSGQVVVLYSTRDSGLWCARGEDVIGLQEGPRPQAPSRKLAATVVRSLPAGAVAFDAMGRRVLNPKSGVYFLRQASSVMRGASSVTKVVIQH